MSDHGREEETLRKIEAQLDRIRTANRDEDWMLDNVKIGWLDVELERLQVLALELPSHLQAKLAGLSREVRGQYDVLILSAWTATLSAGLIFLLFMRLGYRWIFRPLRTLIAGSRRVAAGEFGHRIRLDTRDEMAELAKAMNDMTARFQEIRDDLDHQVQVRTKQAVRSEQLAGVGFLAAGVAHEINNPLASIAMCAESLEGRCRETARRERSATGRHRQLSADDPDRGLPLQGDHREAAGFRPHRAGQAGGIASWASWSAA